MKATVTLPNFRELHLSGTAKGTVSGFDSRAGINFDISGASTLEIQKILTGNITAGDVRFDIK